MFVTKRPGRCGSRILLKNNVSVWACTEKVYEAYPKGSSGGQFAS
jgi:hypothetical protein